MAATTHSAQIGEIVAIDPSAGPWTIECPPNATHTDTPVQGNTWGVKTTNDSDIAFSIDPGTVGVENLHVGEIATGPSLVNQSLLNGVVIYEWDQAVSAWRVISQHSQRNYVESYTWDPTNGWQAVLEAQQLLVSVGPSGLAAKFDDELLMNCQMTAEIILVGNNEDVEFNWQPTISAGTQVAPPVYVPFAHSRAGTFRDTRDGIFAWKPNAPGDTWDLDTVDTGGAGTSTRDFIFMGVSIL